MAAYDRNRGEKLTCTLTIRGYLDGQPRKPLFTPPPGNNLGTWLLSLAILRGSLNDYQMDRVIRTHRLIRSIAHARALCH